MKMGKGFLKRKAGTTPGETTLMHKGRLWIVRDMGEGFWTFTAANTRGWYIYLHWPGELDYKKAEALLTDFETVLSEQKNGMVR